MWMLGGLLLVGAGYRWWRTHQPRTGRQERRRSPPLSWSAVAAAARYGSGEHNTRME
jgi:hypothetical protein